jgi:hypothetical protein
MKISIFDLHDQLQYLLKKENKRQTENRSLFSLRIHNVQYCQIGTPERTK